MFHKHVKKWHSSLKSIRKVSEHLKLHRKTIEKIVRSVPDKRKQTKYDDGDLQELADIIKNNNDFLRTELQEELWIRRGQWVSPATISRMCGKLNITSKRIQELAEEKYTPMAHWKRLLYLSEVCLWPVNMVYFVDETGLEWKVLSIIFIFNTAITTKTWKTQEGS